MRGLCWGLSECLTQTLDGNEGLRPREQAGRAARKADRDRQLGGLPGPQMGFLLS